MKTLFLVLMPLYIFAQSTLPDTLILIDGRKTECLVTKVEEGKIYFNYLNNRSESIITPAVKSLFINELGYVYNSSGWLNKNIDEIKEFVEDRLVSITKQQKINEELKQISFDPEVNQPVVIQNENYPDKSIEMNVNKKTFNKWSFGVLYVPFYSGKTYVLLDLSYSRYPQVYSEIVNKINLEAQLAYSITPVLKATFDAGYTSTFYENKDESHQNYNNFTYSNGSISTTGLKLLDFNLGLKYYFKNIYTEKVSMYASVSFGKQIAFAQEEYKNLFSQPTPGYINEDNREEFIKDLNSPWHFNVGFGTEYFFNESLSLNANIRVLYSSVSGKYNSRYVTPNETNTYTREITSSDFSTKIGLGLNFYF